MIYGFILDCRSRISSLKNFPTKCRNKCNVYGMKCGWLFAFILVQSLHKRHGTEIRIFGYCSLVIFREVIFVSKGHRKPGKYRVNL